MELAATYHDGETAAPRAAALRPDRVGGRLVIVAVDGSAIDAWDFADIRAVRDHGHDRTLVVHRPGRAARLVVAGAGPISDLRAMLPGLGRVEVDRPQVRRVAAWAAGAAGSLLILLFVVIPGLADQMARWIPPAREAAFGQTVMRQIAWILRDGETEPFCESTKGAAALSALATRLEPPGGLPQKVSIRVLNHPMVNAFAVPGGQIVVMRGLIDAADSPDELAAVLAHEIGHVAARDPTRIALRAAGSAGLLGLFFGDVTGGAAAAAASERLMQARYSRAAEAAADDFALAALERARISPDALADFFERLRHDHGDVGAVVGAFLSHPRLADRIATARAAAPGGETAPALSPGEWRAVQRFCDG